MPLGPGGKGSSVIPLEVGVHPVVGDDEGLLTPGEVACLLYVDPKTVTRWALAGKLDAIRTPGGHRRYRRSEVLAILGGRPPLDAAAGLGATVPSPRVAETHDRGVDEGLHAAAAEDRRAAAASVVAEAVAVALEGAAAQAAEDVLVTAAAVDLAARRAAEAALAARGAREFAAAAVARTVAREAARTADRVQVRADVAAAKVEDAASRAAHDLLASVRGGTELDAEEVARVLAATVLAAADTTAAETRRAAGTVAVAVAAAAADVTRAARVSEVDLADHVKAAAVEMSSMAAAAAGRVSRGYGARAAGVALAAREAAQALTQGDDDLPAQRRA